MKALKLTILLVVAFAMTACATVRKQDLDAWVGIPVEALDTHSVFLTMPVYKSTTSSGVEVRNYTNSEDVARCFSSAGGRNGGKHDHSVFTTCSTSRIVCNNIFYIKDGGYRSTRRQVTATRTQPFNPKRAFCGSERNSQRR